MGGYMKELNKFKQIQEQATAKHKELASQIEQLQNDIALNEIKYTNLLRDGELEQATKLSREKGDMIASLKVKSDMYELINSDHITKEVRKQADKTINEAVTNIKRIRDEARSLYNEYEQKFNELAEILDKMKGYNAQMTPYIRVCEQIGKDYPYYAKKHEAYHDGNLIKGEKPSISFKYKSQMSMQPFHEINQKYKSLGVI